MRGAEPRAGAAGVDDPAGLRRREWLTAAQTPKQLSDWEEGGQVFGVNHDGIRYFAVYQFGPNGEPLPVMREILAALGLGIDPWVLAAWFHFPNAWIVDALGKSVAPKDPLNRDGEALRAALSWRESYVA